MPTDLAEVYQRLGGVTAVAEHYDVPRHTAQGWIGRLRHKARQD
jgi:transposase